MRLIDADALYDSLADKLLWLMNYGDETYLSVGNDIRNAIDEQQTAYDVDKVVEQLGEERELSYADFDRYVEEVSPCLDAEYDDFFHRGIERAIRIVKGGGVDDNR